MDIQNLDRVPSFTTKDGSEIRELLAHRNSAIRNQSLAEARLPVAASTTPHYHPRSRGDLLHPLGHRPDAHRRRNPAGRPWRRNRHSARRGPSDHQHRTTRRSYSCAAAPRLRSTPTRCWSRSAKAAAATVQSAARSGFVAAAAEFLAQVARWIPSVSAAAARLPVVLSQHGFEQRRLDLRQKGLVKLPVGCAARQAAGASRLAPRRRVRRWANAAQASSSGGGKCSTAIWPPRANRAPCSTAWRNCRTLPGQVRRQSSSIASCVNRGRRLAALRRTRSRKCSANSGMSSTRSRSGGRRISKAASRK